jgi:hypothetical protein
MTLSPLRGVSDQLTQALDQFFDRKSAGARTGRKFTCHLTELAVALA